MAEPAVETEQPAGTASCGLPPRCLESEKRLAGTSRSREQDTLVVGHRVEGFVLLIEEGEQLALPIPPQLSGAGGEFEAGAKARYELAHSHGILLVRISTQAGQAACQVPTAFGQHPQDRVARACTKVIQVVEDQPRENVSAALSAFLGGIRTALDSKDS